MLSAKDQVEDVKEAWDWGASYYLTKPFDPQELLEDRYRKFRALGAFES